MKKGLLVILVLAILALLLLERKKAATQPASLPAQTSGITNDEIKRTQTPIAPLPAETSQNGTNHPAEPVFAFTTAISNAGPSTGNLPSATDIASDLPPLTVLDNCRVAVHNYHAAFGENPVGDNAEITAALKGKNPKQVNFIREDAGLRVNDRGELVDAYGTPFFFHQLSANLMEIRSAGQDRQLWTFDDIVTR